MPPVWQGSLARGRICEFWVHITQRHSRGLDRSGSLSLSQNRPLSVAFLNPACALDEVASLAHLGRRAICGATGARGTDQRHGRGRRDPVSIVYGPAPPLSTRSE